MGFPPSLNVSSTWIPTRQATTRGRRPDCDCVRTTVSTRPRRRTSFEPVPACEPAHRTASPRPKLAEQDKSNAVPPDEPCFPRESAEPVLRKSLDRTSTLENTLLAFEPT